MSSIYKKIVTSVNNGELSENFSAENGTEEEYGFAPGALDGIHLYHMQLEPMGDVGTKLMAKAFKTVSAGNFKEAETIIKKLTDKYRVIDFIDQIGEYAISHQENLDLENIHRFIYDVILNSGEIECIKFCMAILELFDNEDQDTMDIVRMIGLYDEFTIFSLWIMRHWKNGNDEIFELCKKVHSWGRIHAIAQLECANDEIRSWLISKGIKNDVDYGYSAEVIWTKANCTELLESPDLTYEVFRNLGELIDSLIIEGPVPGISALDDGDELLLKYIERCNDFELQIDDYSLVESILLYYEANEEDEESNKIVNMAHEILTAPVVENVIHEAVKHGKGMKQALSLEIDAYDEFYEYYSTNFKCAYSDIGYLFTNPEYIDKALEVASKYINKDTIKGELTKKLFCEGMNEIQFVLQELDKYPFLGQDIVETALFAPAVMARRRALNVLMSWVRVEEKQLKELSGELFDLVEKLKEIEISDNVMEDIDLLLNGRVLFNENIAENSDD